MISISHVIVGAAVGTAVGVATGSPVVALAAGFASHLVCDLIPHLDHPPAPKDANDNLIWTPNVYVFAIFDSVIAWLLMAFLWYRYFGYPAFSPFIVGAIGAYLPDFIDNVPFWNKFTRPLPVFKQFHDFHEKIHRVWTKRYPMPRSWVLGVTTQIIAIGVSVLYLLYR